MHKVFSEEENPWNGGQFESDFQAWEYIIVGSVLPGVQTLLQINQPLGSPVTPGNYPGVIIDPISHGKLAKGKSS